MDWSIYLVGFLVSSVLLTLEHLTLYTQLARWPLVKFALGTATILAACGVMAALSGDARLLLVPSAAAAGGIWVVLGYGVRWLIRRAAAAAETRGWLKGLADKADIAEECDG